MCHPNSELVEKDLLRIAKSKPTFNYERVERALRDLLQFGQPIEEIVMSLELADKRDFVKTLYIEIVTILNAHFKEHLVDQVISLDKFYYPISPKIRIPVKLPFILIVDNKPIIPLFIFWKRNPLKDKQVSLFITIVKDVLAQYPDLSDAETILFDCSADKGENERTLKVIDTSEVALLDKEELEKMLTIFIEGFEKAQSSISKSNTTLNDQNETYIDPNQRDLFS